MALSRLEIPAGLGRDGGGEGRREQCREEEERGQRPDSGLHVRVAARGLGGGVAELMDTPGEGKSKSLGRGGGGGDVRDLLRTSPIFRKTG